MATRQKNCVLMSYKPFLLLRSELAISDSRLKKIKKSCSSLTSLFLRGWWITRRGWWHTWRVEMKMFEIAFIQSLVRQTHTKASPHLTPLLLPSTSARRDWWLEGVSGSQTFTVLPYTTFLMRERKHDSKKIEKVSQTEAERGREGLLNKTAVSA